MGIVRLGRKVSASTLCAALLAGCGGYGIATYGSLPKSATSQAHPALGESRISPQSRRGDLLYVSDDGRAEIQVFSYPRLKLVGTLTGVIDPEGECTDAAGDVFVANTGSDDVSEFAHGGDTPIANYVDPYHDPFACSVDPTTGNLAVTEYGHLNSIPDSVAIFSSPSSLPTQYFNPLFIYVYCAYDARGNLFVDGYDDRRTFKIVELPKGSSNFEKIVLDKKFQIAGNLAWDGSHMALSNGRKMIYRLLFSGTRGRTVGSTAIDRVKYHLRLFSFQGGMVIVPNVTHEGSIFGKGTPQFYDYPAGGKPTETIQNLEGPADAVVSRKPRSRG